MQQYKGSYSNDKPHGRGTAVFSNGDVYDGEWECGMFDGVGTYTYSDKSWYSGSWKAGMPHGKGKAVYRNKEEYEGEWRGGKFNGEGRYTFNKGKYYNGMWKNGLCDGSGELHLGNVTYTGEWVKGLCHGKGNLTAGKTTYDGEWKIGKPNGKGVAQYKDSSCYDGSWKDGHEHGKGKKTIPRKGEIKNGDDFLLNTTGVEFENGFLINENMCLGCLCKGTEVVLVPCGHSYYCKACWERYNSRTCAQCKRTVEHSFVPENSNSLFES